MFGQRCGSSKKCCVITSVHKKLLDTAPAILDVDTVNIPCIEVKILVEARLWRIIMMFKIQVHY